MALGFRKFISEVFLNGKFPKILPSENFPLYGGLLIVSTNLDGFRLMNHGQFAKFSRYMVFYRSYSPHMRSKKHTDHQSSVGLTPINQPVNFPL